MKYRTIVADPPWPMRVEMRLTRYRQDGTRHRATVVPYPVMSLEAIQALPVSEIAEGDAHLYLWVPAQLNREGGGSSTARAWGFAVVGEIVWVKTSYGTGAFPRLQHEIVLVCRRGHLPFACRDVGSAFLAGVPRIGGGKRHSAKPEAFLDMVERASPGPYLELFARRNRLGWHTWGNEALEHVSLEGLGDERCP